MKPIETRLTLRLADPEHCGRCVPAVFRFDRDRPFEVEFIFPDDSDNTWLFARGLLADGLTDHAGLGDVRVWPERAGQATASVMIRLTGEDASMLFDAYHWAVAGFVKRIYALVPRGAEADHLDVDAGLAGLLARETS